MDNLEQRITNFQKMAQDDPNNELGHFSLGRAYLEAERFQESRDAFQRVLQLNDEFSRAYHHLAEAQLKLGQNDDATAILHKGFQIAHRRGDVMPRDAMAKMIEELGAELPEVESVAAQQTDVGAGQVQCCRCGEVAPKMKDSPLKGALGEQVFAHVCAACWQLWIGMGTKVINEFRLDFTNPQAGEIYDEHMREFLQLPE